MPLQHSPVFCQLFCCAVCVKFKNPETRKGFQRKRFCSELKYCLLIEPCAQCPRPQVSLGCEGRGKAKIKGSVFSLLRHSPELTARLHIVAKEHRGPEPLAGKAVLLICATKNSKLALSVRCLNYPRHSQTVKGQSTVPEQPDCLGGKWRHA